MRSTTTKVKSTEPGLQPQSAVLRVVLDAIDPSVGLGEGDFAANMHIMSVVRGSARELSSARLVTTWSPFWRDLAAMCLSIAERGPDALCSPVDESLGKS